MIRRPTEQQEWLAELEHRWTDVYKKSATTVVILRNLATDGPLDASELAERYVAQTGWTIAERALYRTLQRLANDGVTTTTELDAARTGAKRKVFSLTPMGAALHSHIEAEMLPSQRPIETGAAADGIGTDDSAER